MTRLVTFADGFTSATPPDVTPGAQEDYIILNNQAAYVPLLDNSGNQLILDSTKHKSVFADFELERVQGATIYRQSGTFMIILGLTGWEIQYGNYIGQDLLQISGLASPEHVELAVDSVTGHVTYISGSLIGSTSILKTIMTRILI
jgi:hypothetical protein